MPVWYQVRDLDALRRFYREELLEETFFDGEGRWSKLERGGMEIALAEGEPAWTGSVAHVDVADVKAEASGSAATASRSASSSSSTGRSACSTCSTSTATGSSSPRTSRSDPPRRSFGRPVHARHATHAYYWRWGTPEAEDIPTSRYVEGWGDRRGDDRARRRLSVGAAWYRLFRRHPRLRLCGRPDARASRSPSCRASAARASAKLCGRCSTARGRPATGRSASVERANPARVRQLRLPRGRRAAHRGHWPR